MAMFPQAVIVTFASLGFGVTSASLAASAQDVRMPVQVKSPINVSSLQTAVRRGVPEREVSQDQLAAVRKELSATEAELAQTRDDLAKLRNDFTIYQKVAEVLVERINASDTRFAKHTHRYHYDGVDFTTRWFVTSGRPIVNDEKKDYASVITGTPSYVGETTAPIPPK